MKSAKANIYVDPIDLELFNRRTIFLFAHRDDSVLSASAALSRTLRPSVDVVACGSYSPALVAGAWDLSCDFTTATEAYHTRFREHQSICSILGLETLELPCFDSQYLGSRANNWNHAFAHLLASKQLIGLDLIVTHRGDAHNPDHRMVAELAYRLSSALGIPCVQVCDRPYVHCSSKECSSRNLLGGPFVTNHLVVLSDEQWNFKTKLMEHYRTQLPALRAAFGANSLSRDRLGVECYALATSVG